MSSLQSSIFEPTLSKYYKQAQAKEFIAQAHVPSKIWPKFREFELALRAEGITPKDYSFTVTPIMRPWVSNKRLPYVPAKVFLSNYCAERFFKVWDSKTVVIQNKDEVDRDEILYAELEVARRYIYENAVVKMPTKFGAVVDRLRPFLPFAWQDLYDNGKRRPIFQAMDILNEENASNCNDYVELISFKLHGR